MLSPASAKEMLTTSAFRSVPGLSMHRFSIFQGTIIM